jgi:hypothetical protein
MDTMAIMQTTPGRDFEWAVDHWVALLEEWAQVKGRA